MKSVNECAACRLGIDTNGAPLCTHDHPQAVVLGYDRQTLISMDVGMVGPVSGLWALGIETFNSCQGVKDLAEFLRSERSRPYVQVRRGDARAALDYLWFRHHLNGWAIEPSSDVMDTLNLCCLVPRWAADWAAHWLEERTSVGDT